MPDPAGASPSVLMLVVHVPLHRSGGRLWLDSQACNGLRCWLDNFDRVILCAPLVEGGAVSAAGLSEPAALFPPGSLEIHPLPIAFTPLRFLRVLRSVVRLFDAQIARAAHYQFAIGGSWGDWGALAAILAARRGRKVAIWTDRVESAVMRYQARSYRGARRLYRRFNAWLAERLERHVIRRAALGLFHGMDTYRAYARFSPNPDLAHDIHLGPEARIDAAALAAKSARRDGPIRILYAGRVHPDKGPADWLATLAKLNGRLDFAAIWHGDGPALDAMRRQVDALGLAGRVAFPGHIADRGRLIVAMRDADMLLFCHQTLESPRCLVEALLSGTPIVGYRSDYSADLIAGHGGGLLTEHDPAALADAVLALTGDRDRLAALFTAAAADGWPMVDSAVFRHRAELIKRLNDGHAPDP
jgi:glycosyltransferase involved in cell wall biosynthesis